MAAQALWLVAGALLVAGLLVLALSFARAQRALRDQIRFTQAIMERVPGAIFVKDAKGRYTMANRGWSEMSGVPVERAIGKTVHDLYPSAAAERFAAEDATLLAQGAAAQPTEALHQGPRSPDQWRIVRKAVLSREDGTVIGLVSTSTDISELKRVEAELRASEEKLRASEARYDLALRAVNEGVYDWNVAEGTIFYSENVYRLLGVPESMRTPQDWVRRIHPEDLPRYNAATVEHFKGRTERFECDFRYRAEDGAWRWARQHGIAVRDAAGRAERMIGATGDITALKRIEEELAERARFVGELLDSLPISIALRDTEGRYRLVNRTWEQYFGVRREEALGRRRRELAGGAAVADEIERLDRELLARGAGHVAEPDEQERRGRHYLMTRRVLADSAGRPIGVLSAGFDTTERRRVEQALADEQRRLELVVRGGRVGIVDWDGRTHATYYSPIFREILGWPPDADTSGWPDYFKVLVHPEDRAAFTRRWQDFIKGSGPEGRFGAYLPAQEHRLLRRDGSYVWVRVSGTVVRDEAGFVLRWIGATTDISEEKRIEEALADRARYVTELLDSLPIAVAMRDPQGRYLLVNRAWEQYFGARREAVVGTALRERLGAGDAARVEALDREALARGPGAPVTVEDFALHGRTYSQTRSVMTDEQGRVLGVLSASYDTTERHAQEQRLRDQVELTRAIIESATSGIALVRERVILRCNRKLEEIFGYAPGEFLGQPTRIWYPSDEEHALGGGAVYEQLARGETHRREQRFVRKDGSAFWCRLTGRAIDPADAAKGSVWMLEDVTEERAAAEELRASVRLREEVERMSRHDLKTPLNSVIAVSRLLREGGKLSGDDEELLSIVERAGYRILSMVNLSLDLYRMEQGSYVFQPQSIDLMDVARKVAADLEAQAASKEVALRLRQSGAALARAEELLSYSMLANLVKNAIEATPEGEVVSVTVEGAGERVSVHVHNPGAVPEGVRARFFEKYASSGKSAGLGIGTYSARLMARVQEGDITLHTDEKDGTTVSVRLRAAGTGARVTRRQAPAATGTRAERLPELPPRRVLVVDDDEFNRLVLRRMLPCPPLTLGMAVNGRAALDAARAEWPDVVLLDLEMPVMDGYQAAAELRKLQKANARPLSIIAISSNDDPAIMARARAAGCDHYLVKPAPRETLWRILAGRSPLPSSGSPEVEAGRDDAIEVDADLEASLPEFLATRRRALDDMPGALAAGDRALFKRLAHRLAGSFALYGFKWAAAQCRGIEKDAPAGAPEELLARAAAVRAHLDQARICFVPAKEAAP